MTVKKAFSQCNHDVWGWDFNFPQNGKVLLYDKYTFCGGDTSLSPSSIILHTYSGPFIWMGDINQDWEKRHLIRNQQLFDIFAKTLYNLASFLLLKVSVISL